MSLHLKLNTWSTVRHLNYDQKLHRISIIYTTQQGVAYCWYKAFRLKSPNYVVLPATKYLTCFQM